MKLQLVNQLKVLIQQFFSLLFVQYLSYAFSYEKDLYKYVASSSVYFSYSLSLQISQLSQEFTSFKMFFNFSASSFNSINESTEKKLILIDF